MDREEWSGRILDLLLRPPHWERAGLTTMPQLHTYEPLYTPRSHRAVSGAVLLGLVTSSERVAFKLLVDRAAPFRALLAVAVVLCYSVMMLVVTTYKYLCTDEISADMRKFPQSKVIGMAALDTLQLFMMTLSAAAVTPACTVLLLQASIPITMLLSRVSASQPDVSPQWNHVAGARLIAASAAVGLIPSFAALALAPDAAAAVSAWSTLVYVLSCLPASVSTLYKERALREHAQPMDPNYLNLCLAVYQLLLSLVALPLAYQLQFQGPSPVALGVNIRDGCACILFSRSPIAEELASAHCSWAALLLLIFVCATSGINAVIDHVLSHGSESLMYRAITMSSALSVAVLGLSCRSDPGLFGTSLSWTDLLSLACLIGGLELYHRTQVPDLQFLTSWSSTP